MSAVNHMWSNVTLFTFSGLLPTTIEQPQVCRWELMDLNYTDKDMWLGSNYCNFIIIIIVIIKYIFKNKDRELQVEPS